MAARQEQSRRDAAREKSKPHIEAPWPDNKAREEMSKAEGDRENLGKHSKNEDWEKKW